MEAVAPENEIRAGEKQEQQVGAEAPSGVDEAEEDIDIDEEKEEPEGYIPPADEVRV
jgi:hypothetical protein